MSASTCSFTLRAMYEMLQAKVLSETGMDLSLATTISLFGHRQYKIINGQNLVFGWVSVWSLCETADVEPL